MTWWMSVLAAIGYFGLGSLAIAAMSAAIGFRFHWDDNVDCAFAVFAVFLWPVYAGVFVIISAFVLPGMLVGYVMRRVSS